MPLSKPCLHRRRQPLKGRRTLPRTSSSHGYVDAVQPDDACGHRKMATRPGHSAPPFPASEQERSGGRKQEGHGECHRGGSQVYCRQRVALAAGSGRVRRDHPPDGVATKAPSAALIPAALTPGTAQDIGAHAMALHDAAERNVNVHGTATPRHTICLSVSGFEATRYRTTFPIIESLSPLPWLMAH